MRVAATSVVIAMTVLSGARVSHAQAQPPATGTDEPGADAGADAAASEASQRTESSEEGALTVEVDEVGASGEDTATDADPEAGFGPLRELQEGVNSLKNEIFRSKARLIELQNKIQRDSVTGAKVVLIHRNEMGSLFRLKRVQYSVDGAAIYNRAETGRGELSKQEIEIFNGGLPPGSHQLSVYLEYHGHGYGVFNYLQGYRFKLKSSYTFDVEPSRLTTIKIVSYEKGGLSTDLKDRPAIRYDSSVQRELRRRKNADGTDADIVGSGDADLFTTADAEAPDTTGRWRPGLHVVGGLFVFSRNARINDADAPQTPPCYCPDGGPNPLSPAGYLALELFPFAFGGTGALYEGLGAHLELFLTQVFTAAANTNVTTSSLVSGVRGGLSYRFVWWEGALSPDFRLDVGMEHFAFPIETGPFPGVEYWGQIYAGGHFTVPLATEYLALLAGGHYTFAMEPGGETDVLGEYRGNPTMFHVQTGIRIAWSLLEARLLLRYQRMGARFYGNADLGVGPVFTNPRLVDEVVGGLVSVGVKL